MFEPLEACLKACKEVVAEWDARNKEIMETPGYGPIPDTAGIVLARAAITRIEEECKK
jgi:hypothetical protein